MFCELVQYNTEPGLGRGGVELYIIIHACTHMYECVCVTLYVCNGRACSQRGGGVEGLMNQASIKCTSKLPSFTKTMLILSFSLPPPSLHRWSHSDCDPLPGCHGRTEMKSLAQSQVNGFIETIRKPISLNSCHSNAQGGRSGP